MSTNEQSKTEEPIQDVNQNTKTINCLDHPPQNFEKSEKNSKKKCKKKGVVNNKTPKNENRIAKGKNSSKDSVGSISSKGSEEILIRKNEPSEEVNSLAGENITNLNCKNRSEEVVGMSRGSKYFYLLKKPKI